MGKNSYLILLFVLCILSNCGVQSKIELPDANTNNYSPLIAILHYDKGIIPRLIREIKDTTMTVVDLHNRMDSYIDPILLNTMYNRTGIKYAHLVDYYIANRSRQHIIQDSLQYRPQYLQDIYLYESCYMLYENAIIVKENEDGTFQDKPLSVDDMATISQQYKQWWKKHRHLSVSELCKSFKDEGGILKKPYKWY